MKEKLLFIGTTPPPQHGVSTANETLLKSKLVDEFKVILLDISDRRNLDNLGKFEIMNILLGIKNLILLMIYMIVYRPQVVYLNLSQNKWAYLRDGLFILTSKLFKPSVKVVSHLNGGYFDFFFRKMSGLFQKFILFTLKKVDHVVVVGNNLRYIFENKVKKITVVPNGVSDLHLISDGYNKVEKKYDEIHVTFVSNFFEEKGILDFCDTATKILEAHNDVYFHLAGHFVEEEKETTRIVKEFLENYKNDTRIIFHGVVTGVEKEKLFLASHIFVLPSFYHYEGHPLVLLEALTAGCVLLSTDQGAISEIVEDGRNGFILSKHNSDAFVEKIIELKNNPDKLKKLNQTARQTYLDRFTTKIFSENMISVFRH